MGFVQDKVTRGGVGPVTCPNPAVHSERRDVFPLSLLEQIRGNGLSVSGAGQDALRDRITTAESLLRERTSPPLALEDLTLDTIERR